MMEEVIEAEQVFLLMRENFPISRNARATWFLQHLNKILDYNQLEQKENTKDGEFQIVSVLPQYPDSQGLQYKITQRTVVTFLARHYKIAFVLDISPSVASVDLAYGRVMYSEIHRNLNSTLQSLVKPFRVPGSDLKLCPNLHVTILAHSPIIDCQANQVLVQGCLVTEDNMESILDQVRRGLDAFEHLSRKSMSPLVDMKEIEYEEEEHIIGCLFEDVSEKPEKPDLSPHLITPEFSLVTMLRHGILALQLLPEYSSSGIVVLTDGVLGLADAVLFESVMTQLRHNTICCSFILCVNDFSQNSNLAKVPHTELLQFIATATFGAYFSKIPVVDFLDDISEVMNVFHKALYTWSFHRALEGFKIDDYIEAELFDTTESLVSSVSRRQSSTLLDQIGNPTFLKKKHIERNLHINISHLISCRIREGYTIKDVVFSKGDSQIEVKLVLPWRDFVRIQYAVTSAWPLSSAKRHSHVEVIVEACYEFLHDVTCVEKKPFKSPFRAAIIKKYWQVLHGMSETDQLLVHLQSFASNPVYYGLPESVKQKIPLFYLLTNTNTPQVNFQLHSKDTTVDQFANFWRPVLMLDVNIWQKWMHSHRIALLLEHDRPLGKHLHIPNASGKFHNIFCRQAQLAVNEFLKNFCTFMLMENHSYIKLLFDDPDKPPSTFYVIRVSSKPPCLVLKIAFLGGTPGKVRHQIIHDLEDSLAGLNFPPRGTPSPSLTKLEDDTQSQCLPPPLQRSWSHIPCCVITKKPVEKLLIRYDKVPNNFNTVLYTQNSSDHSIHMAPTANKVASSMLYTMSKYMYHRRWIYSVQHGTSMPISTQAIGRILSNLTRVRLQEGFHFGQTNSGIISMLLEVDMKNPDENEETGLNMISPCVVQYIVFPPHTTTVRENGLDEDYPEATTEADGELQVITECWVEPQYGEIVNSSPQRKHFDGLTYTELPDAMYPTDLECISTMITFEHLNLMCHSVSVPSPALISPNHGAPPMSPGCHQERIPSSVTDASIQHIPFPFDLLRILPKCQQVELLFSTLKQDMLANIQEIHQLMEKSERIKSSSDDTKGDSTNKTNTTHFPNDKLFQSFLDYLKHVHDREIHVTDFQCEQLVPLIRQRTRDTDLHPYPFNFECKKEEPEEELEIGDEARGLGASRRGSCLSLLTNYSVGSTTTGQSQVASLQSNQSQAITQQTANQSPGVLQSGNMPTQKNVTITGNQIDLSGSIENKPTLGQIGKNVSSGSDSKYSQSGISAISGGSRKTGFTGSAVPESKPESSTLQASGNTLVQPSTLLRTFSPPPLDDASKVGGFRGSAFNVSQNLDSSASADPSRENNNIGNQLYLCKTTPKWRCFVKSITSTHVIMCFVPASYEDLLLLSEGIETLNELASLAKQMSVEEKSVPQCSGVRRESSGKPIEVAGKQDRHDKMWDNVVLKDDQKSTISTTRSSSALGKESSENFSSDNVKTEQPKLIYSQQNDPKIVTLQQPEKLISDNKMQSEDISKTVHTSDERDGASEKVQETSLSNVKTLPERKSSSTSNPVDDLPSPIPNMAECNLNNISKIPDEAGDENCSKFQQQNYNYSVTLPVYIYNCPLNYLTEQIVNKWTYKSPGDIYEDLHIKADDYIQQEFFRESEEDPDKRRSRKNLSECEKWHLGTSEKITDDIYGNQKDLKEHCTLVSETYFRSFVNSVFVSLQQHYPVDSVDVVSAINSICEESMPMEIDVTKFLLTGCGHTRQIIERAQLTHIIQEDLKKTFPGVIVSSKNEEQAIEDVPPAVDIVSEETSLVATTTSQQPHSISVRFPLALLNNKSGSSKPCEEQPGLHKRIKRKVHNILSKYFTPVQNRPDYLFYHPPDMRSEDQFGEDYDPPDVSNIADTSMDEGLQDQDVNKVTEADSDEEENCIFYCEQPGKTSTQPGTPVTATLQSADLKMPIVSPLLTPRDERFDGASLMSNKDSLSIDTESRLDDELEDLVSQAGLYSQAPLFIQLMCTVRRKNRQLKSVDIQTLPTCLGELRDCLGEETNEIDLSEITVTLDIIFLTLPPEADLTETTKRPCYTRMTSQISYSSSVEDDEVDALSHPTTDFGLQGETMSDPLKDLPTKQQDAMSDCKDQIVWLLHDEVASSMRHILPVTSDTLEMVAKHVSSSIGRQMCIREEVKLQFVYGAEQSLTHFNDHFQRMNLPGYHLKKEGDYYYVYIDRAHASAKALEDAVSNRLYYLNERSPMVELKEGEGELRCPFLSDSLSLDLTSGSRERSRVPTGEKTDSEVPNITKTSTPHRIEDVDPSNIKLKETKLDSTPSSPERHLVRQKAIDEKDRPPLLNKDSQLSDISVFQSEERDDELIPLPTADDSIEVLAKGPEVFRFEEELEKELKSSGTEQGQNNQEHMNFRAENIKISVTRPSPIREIPPLVDNGFNEDMGQSETTVDGNDVKAPVTEYEDRLEDDRSRHSTGSSIQVINEPEEDEEEEYREENLDAAIQEGKDMNTTIIDSGSSVGSSINGDHVQDRQEDVKLEKDQKPIVPTKELPSIKTDDQPIISQAVEQVQKTQQQPKEPRKDELDTFPQPPEPQREVLQQGLDKLEKPSTEERRMAQAINIISQQYSDGCLPDNRVDAFSKSVHFLKHQSPDTKALDLTPFVRELKTEKITSPEVKEVERVCAVGKEIANRSQHQSPLTVTSPPTETTDRRVQIKRAHSSASFEKYKADHEGNKELVSTRHKRASQSGRVTPARSRHHSGQSGLRTPLSSVFDVSSRGSYGEAGYEGDSSDTEDGTLLSFSDALIQRHCLPEFWLILKVATDYVDVFFHSRDREQDEEFREHIKQYNLVIANIKKICHVVNQKLLLEELYKSRICNPLLVPEADEDVRWWKHDKLQSVQRRKVYRSDSEDSEPDGHGNYLAAFMHISHGHFACDKVWTMKFTLHPRLKTGQGRPTMSRGLQFMIMVMQKFSVNNRTNMFVIRESSTENVFYLKLIETAGDSKEANKGQDDESVLSRSSSIMSLTRRPSEADDLEHRSIVKRRASVVDADEEVAVMAGNFQRKVSVVSDREPDQVSLTSRGSVLTSSMRGGKGEDTVSLVAYGICDVGAEISRDVVQLIQKKLDDAVLDIITDILTRNPKCKLTAEDVQFIQAPGSEPSDVIHFTIPSSALLQQYALGYYLRQNLQGDTKFVFTPKYMDSSKPECMFCDYTQPGSPVIAESDVFLYIRPPQSGGKGLACIQLSFVDGKGKPIQLLTTPKPASQAYKDPFDHAMFEGSVDTSQYEVTHTKGLGIVALVRFQIWKRGDVDIAQLVDKLRLSVKHALCDVVCEYRLLTAPYCEVPHHYRRGVDSPLHSAPTSPALLNTGHRSTAGHHSPVKKQLSELPEKTPKEKSAFSFQTITEMFKPVTAIPGTPKEEFSKVEEAEEQTTWLDVESQRRKEAEIRDKVLKYECGERGHLTPVFTELLPDWFTFCNNLGCPSVQKFTYKMSHRSPVDYILKESQCIVKNICDDVTTKVFMKCQDTYIPYISAKLQGENKSLLDLSQCRVSTHRKHCHFVVVGRNLKQWRSSIEYGYREEEIDTAGSLLLSSKDNKSIQKFKALEPGVKVRQSAETLAPDYVSINTDHYVPRQRLIILHLVEKELTVYTYNWANDANTSLNRQLGRVVSWHNARSHLLDCIISQKMGLFQHHLFGDLSMDINTKDQNNEFVQNQSEIDNLVKSTNPATSQLQSMTRKISTSRPAPPPHLLHHPTVPLFDDLYRDTKPTAPLHKCQYGNLTDALHRHGAQMMELKAFERKGRERVLTLEKIYLMWQQRTGASHMPIDTNTLTLLKTSSRLVHSVSTPLLFSPHWRRNIQADWYHKTSKNEAHSAPSDGKPRSRHGSGASLKSKRSGSIDGKRNSSLLESPDPHSKYHHTTSDLDYEESWHVDLRSQYIEQYIQYIQSLSFNRVMCRPSIDPSQGLKIQKEKPCKYSYLQKTLPGGIMLIEIGFSGVHFGVHVYALEFSRLPVGRNVNRHLEVIFTDECDKFKDLTHVHSFTHDFHLRMIQKFISNQQVFRPGYHLTSFLKHFTSHFSYVPSFARNCIYEGTLKVEETTSSGQQLYDYMRTHDKLYGLKAVEMDVQMASDEIDALHNAEYALVCQRRLKSHDGSDVSSVHPGRDAYLAGVVIAHDPPLGSKVFELERNCLHLRYWVIITNETETFPIRDLEQRIGLMKVAQIFPATQLLPTKSPSALYLDQIQTSSQEEKEDSTTARLPDFKQYLSSNTPKLTPPLSIKKQIGFRQDEVNYLGFSTSHQTPMYSMLVNEAETTKSEIKDMVENAKSQCRRDTLWQRMLLNNQNTDDLNTARRRHKSAWVELEDKDPLMQKLTFTEFEELLTIVDKTALYDIDTNLVPLHNMSLSWYQGLIKVFINRHSDGYRHFSSADNLIQHLVLLNPKDLDMFMMVTVDNIGSKNELCAVFRKQYIDDQISQDHMESFVNTCAYHVWGRIL